MVRALTTLALGAVATHAAGCLSIGEVSKGRVIGDGPAVATDLAVPMSAALGPDGGVAARSDATADRLSGDGESCSQQECEAGLLCVTILQSQTGAVAGSYCLEQCRSAGSDAICDGTEVCTPTREGLLICFAGDRADHGFADEPDSVAPAGSAACGDADESEALRLINAQRQSNGRRPLACDQAVLAAARAHSRDMCTREFESHVNPDGESHIDRLSEAGVVFSGAGENIAVAFNSPAELVSAWMSSAGHRSNILSANWTRAGVGRAQCGQLVYWTADFVQ